MANNAQQLHIASPADQTRPHGRALKLVRDGDEGMATAEYAIGTVAVAGFAGILLKLLSSPEIQSLLWSVIQKAFEWIFA